MRKEVVLIIVLVCLWSCNLSAQRREISGMRVISYNLLEGMKLDSSKNKALFTAWVKRYDPTVLAIQEANGFTQQSIEKLAKQYGHPYAVLVKESGYPTAITSKEPILFVQKVVDNMTHGFIQATIGGCNFIVLHLNPHHEKKRREELNIILQTVKQTGEKRDWLIMGDFNSVSPLDSLHYSREKDYTLHAKIESVGFKDVLSEKGFEPTIPTKRYATETKESVRYDFIYVSKKLKKQVVNAFVIRDDFTDNYSDHYPILVDFR